MVMHQLTDPPQDEDWIGLEDQLSPVEVRQRIRGKVSLNHFAYEQLCPEGLSSPEVEEMKEEEEKEDQVFLRTRRVIEEEMKHAVEDHP